MWQQTGMQILAVLVMILWSGFMSLLLLGLLNRLLGLRVSPDQKTEGLDIALHNGKAYHL